MASVVCVCTLSQTGVWCEERLADCCCDTLVTDAGRWSGQAGPQGLLQDALLAVSVAAGVETELIPWGISDF